MNNAGEPAVVAGAPGEDDRLLWIGVDDRGVELEVIGIDLPDYLLIMHVMPYACRRNR